MELHFALSERLEREVHALLFPGQTPNAPPERGVIGIIYPSRGRRRTTLLLHKIIPPGPGEVTWHNREGLLFSTSYKSRATSEAAALPGAGLIFIHTHPNLKDALTAPRPSAPDIAADRRDLFYLGASLPGDVPLAAGVLGENGLWSVRAYAFRYPSTAEEAISPAFSGERGSVIHATAVRVVGRRLRKLPTEVIRSGPAGSAGGLDGSAQDSTVRLWGEQGQRILSGLRIAITGLGGVGGILAEHVARLGAGELVLVDFDRIQEDNLNRSQGATRQDAAEKRPKVEVAERLALMAATAPGFTCSAHEASVVEAATIPLILDCDVVLNAADSPWARQVLDHLAYAHLIPVINGGTQLIGNPKTGVLIAGKSEVTLSGPGHICMQCAGVYDIAAVTEAQEHPTVRGVRAYATGGDESVARAPSIISANALVAAIMQLRLQALALGTTPDAASGTQRYHVTEGRLDWAAASRCKADCPRPGIEALGDSYALPTGVDLDFQVVRQAFSGAATGGSRPQAVRDRLPARILALARRLRAWAVSTTR